ncbi:GDSL-type esterase/lipase family protein [Pedobacter sp. SYP-B3415]|uniref:GDSL-type esterase/lipase family protein n=1 Tax=Pedobacter sp. SYP-B3415 TaxID=2496641 RepID=UPI001F10CB3E|nr:GDSL-type esterase/lipase family protein [Pedobacter sp. SYP-B3415]
MKKNLTGSLLFLLLTTFMAVNVHAQGSRPPFFDEVQAFKKKDSTHRPAAGGIVFVGSSSVRMWSDLENRYKAYNAINRGFGGSTLKDAAFYTKELVSVYRPRQVVIYSGENDLAAGASAYETLNRFAAFFTNIRNNQPDVPVIFISIKESPSRTKIGAAVLHTNALIKEYMSHYPNTRFVEVNSKMKTANGKLRPELFKDDMLHMKPAGYEIWARELTPYLLK